jgi:hypothetical protein
LLAGDSSSSTLGDTNNDAADEQAEETRAEAKSPVRDSAAPEFTTRLPGVSANDMPRFRRHMYRTDI